MWQRRPKPNSTELLTAELRKLRQFLELEAALEERRRKRAVLDAMEPAPMPHHISEAVNDYMYRLTERRGASAADLKELLGEERPF